MFDPHVWGWPQYVWMALSVLSLGISLAKHGEPETGKKSIWMSLTTFAIVGALLYFGGFFAAHGCVR